MAKVTQLTVTAESKPGVLARICDVLAGSGINIQGICAGDSAGRSKLRLLVSDPGRARAALAAAKIRAAEEPALLLTLDDKPGTLGRVASRLAAARINIKCTYATTAPGAGQAQVVIVVANPDKAEKALG